jgi:tetratricopeptide (TPR) repeat protein
MGPALYRLCNFENSLQFFSESLSKDPNNVEILTNKGSALGKLGYYDEAILHYEKAIKIDSDFLPAINNKANALANMGNYDDAISLYAEALGKNPSYTTAKQNLELIVSESLKNYEQIKLQKEKSPDFFEQVDSMLSSIVSIFGISN